MVYVPGISSFSLERRKGGGGGGRGGGGRSSGKSSSKSSKSSSKSSKSTKSTSVKKGSKGNKKTGFAVGAGAGAATGTYLANPYSWGGGHSYIRANNVPFAGRLSGNGTRAQVFGTSRYGSGYPYGGNGFVSARPFPFIFWPVPIAIGYYGADTYADYSDSVRPGGDINIAPIKSTISSTPETYHLIGDRSSLKAVIDALVSNCSVAATSQSYFAPRSPPSQPATTEFVQWYRASTFGLALDGYNNTASSPMNMTSETTLPPSADTPLPSGLNTTFLACVNSTIGMAVPLLAPSSSSTAGKIAGIVIGSVLAAVALVSILFSVWRRRKDRRHGHHHKWMHYAVPCRRKKKKHMRTISSQEDENQPENLPAVPPMPQLDGLDETKKEKQPPSPSSLHKSLSSEPTPVKVDDTKDKKDEKVPLLEKRSIEKESTSEKKLTPVPNDSKATVANDSDKPTAASDKAVVDDKITI